MDFPSSLDRGSDAFQNARSKNAAAPLWFVGCVCCALAPAETSRSQRLAWNVSSVPAFCILITNEVGYKKI